MSPGKKRVAKKATTLEKSTVDADEDDWNKSPIRTLTWGRDAPVTVLFFSYQRLSTGWRVFFQNVSNLHGFMTRRTTWHRSSSCFAYLSSCSANNSAIRSIPSCFRYSSKERSSALSLVRELAPVPNTCRACSYWANTAETASRATDC